MFLFNLSLGEFMALFSAASAVVVTLYLLDRSRRAVVVATLRFWTHAERPVESTRRRRIRQWPSMLLQLASIACLLLAISQLRLGSPDQTSRDHVLILDTSAWMSARAGNASLMEDARAQALAYLKAIPSTDRVLVMYAGALATPVTAFEADRRKLERAVRDATPGEAALDLRQALESARRLQARSAKRGGEIVFAGAGRTPEQEGDFEAPPNLRVLAVQGRPENTGLRKIGLRHSANEADLWHIYVSVKNYGLNAANVDLGLQFGGAPVGTRRMTIAPNSEQESAFEFRTRAAGPLEARIRSAGDRFPRDDRATLEIPAVAPVEITVCSDEPQLLKPLVESNANVRATYLAVAACQGKPQQGIVLYDRFVPTSAPGLPAIYIEPPAQQSPIPVKTTVSAVALERWNGSHPLGAGLRAREIKIASTQVFAPAATDASVGESGAGPVIVARERGAKLVVFGFHPMRAGMRYELATPLLFANVLRWMAPDSFRRWELYAGSVGAVMATLEAESDAAQVKVIGPDGTPLPFTVHEKTVRFFAGKPGVVRVVSGDKEQIHALTLPSVPDSVWAIPATARKGVPRARAGTLSSRDIWQWLALLGGLGLLLEWLWFAPAGSGVPAMIAARFRKEPVALRRAS